ncbi:MAG: HAD-IIIA family hydrolase, partial [SAR324 cluster bacterium]|nr:HAD-IIIA family hydrolase [SAR324 cluster bacterium]
MKNSPLIQKIKSREEASACVKQWQNKGEKVGFTSGSFDLLHLGHVEYLEEASRHCDRLVVAINSDASVRAYKGPKRPICDERSRLHVIASLSSVDLVFLFDETNNNTNVKVLRPDLYIKAGDYTKSRMTSADIVESQGGKVLIVPFATGYSSSGIIERILEVYGDEQPKSAPKLHYKKAPAIFIDRDGTINEEFDYIDDPKLFKLIPGAMEAIYSLESAGYRIVIVTNQPGIGFGYYSKQDFFRVNKKMLEAASA